MILQVWGDVGWDISENYGRKGCLLHQSELVMHQSNGKGGGVIYMYIYTHYPALLNDIVSEPSYDCVYIYIM